MLFRKLDLNNNGKLRFSEFSDLFSPIDQIYKDHLEKKRPSEDGLSEGTKEAVKDLMRNILRSENHIEDYRQLLNSKKGFSYSHGFSVIDSNKNGYLAKDEFQQVLE